jgi:hypothetical protein
LENATIDPSCYHKNSSSKTLENNNNNSHIRFAGKTRSGRMVAIRYLHHSAGQYRQLDKRNKLIDALSYDKPIVIAWMQPRSSKRLHKYQL